MNFDRLYNSLKPFLFKLDPEMVHNQVFIYLTIFNKVFSSFYPIKESPQSKPCELNGITFRNPIGLAAGLDKNGEYIDLLSRLGFGYIEIGTVTPKPQSGNIKPRLFRLEKDGALINRMGFNNQGIDKVISNIKKSKWVMEKHGVLGINLGINSSTRLDFAYEDYNLGLEKSFSLADYFVINISSPNTKDLRKLHEDNHLEKLLQKIKYKQNNLNKKYKTNKPIFFKISPDLSENQLEEIAKKINYFEIEGIIISNTTESRLQIIDKRKSEKGGLSGKPLKNLSMSILKKFKSYLNSSVTIIGSGGISSAEDAEERLKTGAHLVQIYTGIIYSGPQLIKEIHNKLDGKFSS